MDPEVISAYIAAAVAVGCAILTTITTRASERKARQHEVRIEEFKARLEGDVRYIEAQLADKNAERDARRDYEYEARKRLYTEVEPILFQLVELSEAALHRIYSLARTARLGNLSDPATSWLRSDEDYYYRSTLYALLAPMAAVKLLQRRITFVDLSVEKSIAAEYTLAKKLFITFTDDFELARCEPAVQYDPHSRLLAGSQGNSLLDGAPEVYWKQGVVLGDVETAAQSLLVDSGDGRPARVKSYSEFDKEMENSDSDVAQAMQNIRYLFLWFHPARRPVLWRILVVQACLYNTFLNLRDAKLAGKIPSSKPLTLIPASERDQMDWIGPDDTAWDKDLLGVSFESARRYLQKAAPELFDPTL